MSGIIFCLFLIHWKRPITSAFFDQCSSTQFKLGNCMAARSMQKSDISKKIALYNIKLSFWAAFACQVYSIRVTKDHTSQKRGTHRPLFPAVFFPAAGHIRQRIYVIIHLSIILWTALITSGLSLRANLALVQNCIHQSKATKLLSEQKWYLSWWLDVKPLISDIKTLPAPVSLSPPPSPRSPALNS